MWTRQSYASGRGGQGKVPARKGGLFDRAAVFCGDGLLIKSFASSKDARAGLYPRGAVIDASGLEALTALREQLKQPGSVLMFAGVNDKVRTMLDAAG